MAEQLSSEEAAFIRANWARAIAQVVERRTRRMAQEMEHQLERGPGPLIDVDAHGRRRTGGMAGAAWFNLRSEYRRYKRQKGS